MDICVCKLIHTVQIYHILNNFFLVAEKGVLE